MNTLLPFQPPAFSRRTAHTLNALLPLTNAEGYLPCAEGLVRILVFPCVFAPSIRVVLQWFGGTWTIDVGGMDATRIHPLLRDLPPEAVIPEELRQAALDMMIDSALEHLTVLGGSPQNVEGSFLDADMPLAPDHIPTAKAAGPFLWLELALPEGERFPMCVHLPEENAPVQALLMALQAAAQCTVSTFSPHGVRSENIFAPELCLCVEAGAMRLSVDQCNALGVGDVLLPDDYPAHNNMVRLIFASRSPMPVLHCSVCDFTATIQLLTLPPEPFMTDISSQEALLSPSLENSEELPEAPPVAEDTPTPFEESIPVQELDLAVSFELERRLMTVAEVAALRPGHTFTLTVEPLSPVTVRVQGKAIGTGRLVDLGGTLGIQITSLV